MKVLKRHSSPELKVQQLEEKMRELGIRIETNTELYIEVDDLHLVIQQDGRDSHEQALPRTFDEERLVIFE